MHTCYSDHNEDIRTKGACDYCLSTIPIPDAEPLSVQVHRAAMKKVISSGFKVRMGQAAFNALVEIAPEVADRVRSTRYDPFYDDNLLDRFYVFIDGEDC